MALAQGRLNKRWVRRILLQAMVQVFSPLSKDDPETRREPVSIKKLQRVTACGVKSKLS